MRAKELLKNGDDAASRLNRSLQRVGINLGDKERYYRDLKNKSIEKEKEYKSQGIINVTPKDVHDIADEKGIPWDNEPNFLELSKKLTGTAHLDDMNQKQLVQIYKHLYDLDKSFAEAWSMKYKRSINCSNPKGFSQRAHCQGRKKHETIQVENFADGKNPGRKGLAKRSGVPTKASVSRLRQIAKSSSGEKQRMAHWLANMKAGKKK